MKVTLSTVGRISVARQSHDKWCWSHHLSNLKFKFGRKKLKKMIVTKKVIVIIKSFWAWCQVIMSRWCWKRNDIFRTHFGVLSPFLPVLKKECVLKTDSSCFVSYSIVKCATGHNRCVLVKHYNIWLNTAHHFLLADNKAERFLRRKKANFLAKKNVSI